VGDPRGAQDGVERAADAELIEATTDGPAPFAIADADALRSEYVLDRGNDHRLLIFGQLSHEALEVIRCDHYRPKRPHDSSIARANAL